MNKYMCVHVCVCVYTSIIYQEPPAPFPGADAPPGSGCFGFGGGGSGCSCGGGGLFCGGGGLFCGGGGGSGCCGGCGGGVT
jgi:hypothetical protein